MRTCRRCNATLNDTNILELCDDCYMGRKTIEEDPAHPAKRPPEWPTHCESCGVEFKETNTYCYNYCPDC